MLSFTKRARLISPEHPGGPAPVPTLPVTPVAGVGPRLADDDQPAVAGVSPSASVARGAIALLTTQPITWATSLLAAAFLPRFLGDAGLGQYALAMTVAAVAGTFVSLGVPNYLVRRVVTQPSRSTIDAGAALVLLVGVSALTALVLWLLLPFLNIPVSLNVLRFALAGMVVGAASVVLSALLQGRESHRRFAWLNAANQVVVTLGSLAVLGVTRSIEAFMATGLVALLVMLAVTWYFTRLRLHRTAFAPRLLWQLVVGGVPFMGWNVALAVYTEMDKFLLAMFSSSMAIGWYASAFRIISIPGFITTAVVTPLLPALSRSAGDRVVFLNTLRRSVTVVLFITAGVSAVIVGAAPGIPGLLGWPASFSSAVPLLMILALRVPLTAVDTALGTALVALHSERRWLGVAIVAAVVNPAANFVLIPFFERRMQNGAIGAALVTVATELLMFCGAVILLPRGTLDRPTLWIGARILVAAAGAASVTAILEPLSILLAAPAGGIAFLVAAAALRIVRLADLWTLRTLAMQMLERRAVAPAPVDART